MTLFRPLFAALLLLTGLAVHAEDEPPADGTQVPPVISYYALDPDIITNYLGDSRTLGYVRVTVELMAANEGDKKIIETNDPLIRDTIIRLLGSKTGDQIKSLVTREELRKECEDKVNELLLKEAGKKAVKALIFTKFLYQ
ncbi:flagellar basal body-associated FliL family protein [Aeromonas schubertii]|uniref:Flagellar protein FliL n=1 Tax=Aeromonas schubertii TaxID=652 RepID=A0A0S2SHT3_9GAMM|nr:flagellar basal body-associated FliL family protein [Aeromonas schubertii]ALP41225.1 flagellar basal body-associated protein FliL [Aeromonas schubertii]